MKTLHLDPSTRERAALVSEEIDKMLADGKSITVTLAEERELLSPNRQPIASASLDSTSCA